MTTSLLNSLLRALLRWGAARVFCLPLRHRTHFWARACGMLFPLLLLAQLLDPLAQSTTLWQQQLLLLVLYISFFALLGGMIYLCTDINKKGALYCAVWSLVVGMIRNVSDISWLTNIRTRIPYSFGLSACLRESIGICV